MRAKPGIRTWGMVALLGLMLALGGWVSTEVAKSSGRTEFVATPDWVDPIDAATLPSGAPRDGYTDELIDEQWLVQGDHSEQYIRRIFHIDSEERAERLGTRGEGLATLRGDRKLALHALRRYRDGQVDDLSSSARLLVEKKPGVLKWRSYRLRIYDVEPGDRVELEYGVVRSPAEAVVPFSINLLTAFPVRVETRRIVVHHPVELPLTWKLHGDTFSFSETTNGGRRRLEWRASPSPSGDTESEFLELSAWTSWAQLAAWADEQFRLDTEDRHAVAELSRSLGLERRSDADILLAALAYVQDRLEYRDAAPDQLTRRPRSVTEILASGYGDCKDKSHLLAALLRDADIRADIVLVNVGSGRDVDPRLPSANQFNHVIARARVAGEWIYVDPTRVPDAGERADLETELFGLGLPSAASGGDLATIPAPTDTRGGAIAHLRKLNITPGAAHGATSP